MSLALSVCLNATWQKARDWFAGKAQAAAQMTIDVAGNSWARIAGTGPDALVMGRRLDCVPNGGWLDGALGVLGALEVLRRFGKKGTAPKKTIYAVSGRMRKAPFRPQFVGSSAAGGTMDVANVVNG